MNPLESIDVELKSLVADRAAIDRKITALEEAKKTLLQVYEQLDPVPSVERFVEPTDVGMTDAVRGAFRLNADRLLTPVQIREIVESHGFFALRKAEKGDYRNALAAIHQVISRLLAGKEIEGPFPQGNEKVYRWRRTPEIDSIIRETFQVGTTEEAYREAMTHPFPSSPSAGRRCFRDRHHEINHKLSDYPGSSEGSVLA